MNRAVFLDRDGVLVEDVDLLTSPEQLRILDSVPEALKLLRAAGFMLVVVTNQPVVARGMVSEAEVERIHRELESRIVARGGVQFDAFYFCPHHPKATLTAYRIDCECRKPASGMLVAAARRFEIDLSRSFMVGDRITDVIAGASVGCRTILLETGRHLDAPITTSRPVDLSIKADYTVKKLGEAVSWILNHDS